GKYLPARHYFAALAQHAEPDLVDFWIITNRGRIDCRAALRAKCLRADHSAVGSLAVFRRLARQKYERTWPRANDRSQRSPTHRLAIGAVAERRRFRIG